VRLSQTSTFAEHAALKQAPAIPCPSTPPRGSVACSRIQLLERHATKRRTATHRADKLDLVAVHATLVVLAKTFCSVRKLRAQRFERGCVRDRVLGGAREANYLHRFLSPKSASPNVASINLKRIERSPPPLAPSPRPKGVASLGKSGTFSGRRRGGRSCSRRATSAASMDDARRIISPRGEAREQKVR